MELLFPNVCLLNSSPSPSLEEYSIVHEEDVEASADYFHYFSQTLPLLQLDPTLYCISAWNDLVHSEVEGSRKLGDNGRSRRAAGRWFSLMRWRLKYESAWGLIDIYPLPSSPPS